MHILITGGAGFIGSHLVDKLLIKGNQVTVVDNFDPFYAPACKEQNIQDHLNHPNYTFYRLDLREDETLRTTLSGNYDVIVHLAAKAGVRPSIEDPLSYQEVNVRGTQNLLELAKQWGTKQFVFASSSSVYGVNPNVPWRETDQGLMPISPYASTKVSGELMGHVYSHLYDMRFIGLRFFTVYGPRQRPDLAIHKFARLMLEGKPIPFFGDGSTRRDYTFVDDITDGIISAINYQTSRYEVINLGNNRTVTLNEMIETLEESLGVKAKLQRLPQQLGDVPQTWADLTKARQLLGYQPKVEFGEGINKFTEWLKNSTIAVDKV